MPASVSVPVSVSVSVSGTGQSEVGHESTGSVGGSLFAVASIMLKDFRAYQLSIEFYHKCEGVKCSKHLREQLSRSSSSIPLNLAEGSCQPTQANRLKYYFIALGSLRESQTILDLAKIDSENEIFKMADQLGGQLYKLCQMR